MPEAVIVSTARSPIGRAFKGSLRDLRPDELALAVVSAALAKVPGLDPAELDDVYLGCAEPWAEQGSNMARTVAVLAGLDQVPGATVNRYCASSLQTTRMAFHAIRAGEGDAFVSVGVEMTSRYPNLAGTGLSLDGWRNPLFLEARARSEVAAAANTVWTDPRELGLLPDVHLAYGQTAENVATVRHVSRQAQDEWAVLSQNRAEQAGRDGFFAREITPVTTPDGTVVDTDDCPRPGITLQALARLQPIFRDGGTVTAGNSCPMNDGAAALVVLSEDRARDLGLTPLARVVSTGVSALSPELMGMGPVQASRQALARAGMSIGDVDLVEINEAFAAQVLPVAADLGVDHDRLNVHGGAIALGHPFGMSGARITTTLLHALAERDAEVGMETMCVGGGQGMSIIYQRLG